MAIFWCELEREKDSLCEKERERERERVRECERGYSDIIAVKKLCMRLLNS